MGFFKQVRGDQERRQHTRIRATEDFLVEFNYQGKTEIISASGRDLSEGGLRFASYEKLKKGQKLSLRIYFRQSFPGIESTKLVAPATVVRCYKLPGTDRYRIGCQLDVEQTPEPIRQFLFIFQVNALSAAA